MHVCLVCFRLHNAVQAKQKDKQTLGQMEKRLKVEQEARAAAERQLAEEKKRKKLEEATAARAVALAAASRYAASRRYARTFVLSPSANSVHLQSLHSQTIPSKLNALWKYCVFRGVARVQKQSSELNRYLL